jgi:hypothetical protein
MTLSKEDLKRRRRTALPIVIYVEDESEGAGDAYCALEELNHSNPIMVIDEVTSRGVMALVTEMLRSGYAVNLTDCAAFAVQQFAWVGEDYQANAGWIVEALTNERDRHYDAEHPEKDPLYGLNDTLTPQKFTRGVQ